MLPPPPSAVILKLRSSLAWASFGPLGVPLAALSAWGVGGVLAAAAADALPPERCDDVKGVVV